MEDYVIKEEIILKLQKKLCLNNVKSRTLLRFFPVCYRKFIIIILIDLH